MLDQYIKDVKNWAAHPYKEDGSLLDWILFIGVLTAATILWTRVIKRLVD
jgi:hypothetical protein